MIVLPPDRQILHNIPRTFVVDGQEGVRHPVGMAAQRLEVETHVVTGAAALVENVIRCARQAGLTVDEVVLEPIASGLAVVSEAEKAIGCVLADIGGGTTDLAIYSGGGLFHTAALPVGGNHLTYDLCVGLRIPPQRGEQIKKEHGAALTDWVLEEEFVEVQRLGNSQPQELPRRLIAEIIQPRMEQLFSLVGDEISRVGMEDSDPGRANPQWRRRPTLWDRRDRPTDSANAGADRASPECGRPGRQGRKLDLCDRGRPGAGTEQANRLQSFGRSRTGT